MWLLLIALVFVVVVVVVGVFAGRRNRSSLGKPISGGTSGSDSGDSHGKEQTK